jgi:hypothetical protein
MPALSREDRGFTGAERTTPSDRGSILDTTGGSAGGTTSGRGWNGEIRARGPFPRDEECGANKDIGVVRLLESNPGEFTARGATPRFGTAKESSGTL